MSDFLKELLFGDEKRSMMFLCALLFDVITIGYLL
jgi:hypothetical protein